MEEMKDKVFQVLKDTSPFRRRLTPSNIAYRVITSDEALSSAYHFSKKKKVFQKEVEKKVLEVLESDETFLCSEQKIGKVFYVKVKRSRNSVSHRGKGYKWRNQFEMILDVLKKNEGQEMTSEEIARCLMDNYPETERYRHGDNDANFLRRFKMTIPARVYMKVYDLEKKDELALLK